MIRSILASSWLPLLYWGAAIVAMICWAHHYEALELRPVSHEIDTVASASTPTPPTRQEQATAAQRSPDNQLGDVDAIIEFWSPQCFALEPLRSSALRHMTDVATNPTMIPTDGKTPPRARATMLSFRADPPGQATPAILTIQCRTTIPISTAQGKAAIIDGVVTQEVVSSSGKILIMAGSKVVGSGVFDLENGRFKSNGLWSIFFDRSEVKVRANLLDRPAGLPGILGQEGSDEDEVVERKALKRGGPPIFVPRGAPFVLELHDEMQLRDVDLIDGSS